MVGLPLLRGYSPGDHIFICKDGQISCASFLDEVNRIGALIPDKKYVINLCSDRCNFLLGFACALIRGQTTLLPPSLAPEAVLEIANNYDDVYLMVDNEQLSVDKSKVSFLVNPQPGDNRDGADIPLIQGDQLAAIMFTSGSTGQPQESPKTWGSLVAGAHLATKRFDRAGGVKEFTVCTTPQQHMFGLEASIITPTQAGSPIYSGRPFFPEDVRVALELGPGPKVLITTPVHLRSCVDEEVDISVDTIISATAPLSKELAYRAEKLFGAKVYEIFGFTEAGAIASRRTIEDEPWLCFDGVRVVQKGEDCFVSGGHLSEAQMFNDFIDIKSNNQFYHKGRHADLINIAGKRISLGFLNKKLLEIEGVKDGVFYYTDDQAEKVARLIAFVVAPGVDTIYILERLRQKIDPVALPRPMHMVDSLPRSQTGKLPREALMQLAESLGA